MVRYAAIGCNVWLDLYADASTLRDTAVFALSLSLSHVAVNEAITPYDKIPFCLPTSALGAVLYTIVCFCSTVGLVARALSIERTEETSVCVKTAPRCRLRYGTELAWDAFATLAGAWMQVTAKPPQWFISLPLSNCTIHDSPINYASFFLGEVLSFGSGVRVLLLLAAATHRSTQRAGLRAAGLLVAMVLSLVLAAIFYVTDPPLTAAIEKYRLAVDK